MMISLFDHNTDTYFFRIKWNEWEPTNERFRWWMKQKKGNKNVSEIWWDSCDAAITATTRLNQCSAVKTTRAKRYRNVFLLFLLELNVRPARLYYYDDDVVVVVDNNNNNDDGKDCDDGDGKWWRAKQNSLAERQAGKHNNNQPRTKSLREPNTYKLRDISGYIWCVYVKWCLPNSSHTQCMCYYMRFNIRDDVWVHVWLGNSKRNRRRGIVGRASSKSRVYDLHPPFARWWRSQREKRTCAAVAAAPARTYKPYRQNKPIQAHMLHTTTQFEKCSNHQFEYKTYESGLFLSHKHT